MKLFQTLLATILLLLLVVTAKVRFPLEEQVNLLSASAVLRFYPQVVATILRRHFSHSHEAVLIQQAFQASSSSSFLQQQDFINGMIQLLNGDLVVRFFEPRSDPIHAHRYNVLVVDGHYGSFRRIYASMDYRKFDSSGYYLVVIVGAVGDGYVGDVIQRMLEDLWVLDIYNVNVLLSKGEDAVQVHTYFPYSPNQCGKVKPVVWYNITSMAGYDLDLYPNRLTTFHGCPLIGGTFEAKPYTIIPKQANDSSTLVVGGFEGDLVNLLMERLNFTIRYEIAPNGSQWGFAREPGNSTGLMKLIQEEQVHFGFACLAFTYDRNRYLKAGLAHHTSQVLFAVPAGRPFSAFEKLFCPFSATIWALTLICLTAGVVVVLVLQFTPQQTRNFVYGSETSAPVLNMLQVYFGGAMPKPPRRNFSRTILFLWIGSCFILRTLYQSSLYLYLQRTMNHEPLKTMNDIHRSGLPYYMMEIGERYFRTMPHILERVIHIQPGRDSLGRMIDGLGRGLVEGVVLTTQDHVAYHNKLRSKQQFVHVAQKNVAAYPVGFYYPKKSSLSEVFDGQIRFISASGLGEFWVRRYGDYDFSERRLSSSTKLKRLSNQHLAGGYQIYVGCLALSCAIFALELLSVRWEALKRVLHIIGD
ncbi:uncharacterized protein LOC128746449 [Sabethes cyaneus]|uniref:uncharacterized protein LOC128746449 n=1 Tax=Sabethes cyaneus TaxID=53552 RepID=UPI00237EA760|nr:uncharacterized protein LOC128746449 [Sabethes cyaneus]